LVTDANLLTVQKTLTGDLEIGWPNTVTQAVPEVRSLAPDGAWNRLEGELTNSNGWYRVQFPPPREGQFYRLIGPIPY
jgi:hypothetical protein